MLVRIVFITFNYKIMYNIYYKKYFNIMYFMLFLPNYFGFENRLYERLKYNIYIQM